MPKHLRLMTQMHYYLGLVTLRKQLVFRRQRYIKLVCGLQDKIGARVCTRADPNE